MQRALVMSSEVRGLRHGRWHLILHTANTAVMPHSPGSDNSPANPHDVPASTTRRATTMAASVRPRMGYHAFGNGLTFKHRRAASGSQCRGPNSRKDKTFTPTTPSSSSARDYMKQSSEKRPTWVASTSTEQHNTRPNASGTRHASPPEKLRGAPVSEP